MDGFKGGVELFHDDRQGNIDDAAVHGGHEDTGGDQHEGNPFVVVHCARILGFF
ncbi:hypothetical protein DESC_300006 [Desulfosarcina cetonica]|nr:hypothetical protein DESC_300006 [Desulfosarcina cetonica]